MSGVIWYVVVLCLSPCTPYDSALPKGELQDRLFNSPTLSGCEEIRKYHLHNKQAIAMTACLPLRTKEAK